MRVEGQGEQSSLRKRRKDVGSQLIEQIRALAGPNYDVKMVRERPWASITFSGTRHRVAISRSMAGDTGLPPSFTGQIADHEFDLPGHFVADVLIDDREMHGEDIIAEILTIIDPVAAGI